LENLADWLKEFIVDNEPQFPDDAREVSAWFISHFTRPHEVLIGSKPPTLTVTASVISFGKGGAGAETETSDMSHVS